MTFEQRALYVEQKPREQRSFATGAVRLGVAGVQVRSAEDGGGLVIDGYASVTNSPYSVTDWLGEYTETITRGAFAKSLAEQDDVRFLINHDGIPIARTKSGTLALSEDERGLKVHATLDGDSPLVQTVRSAIARGDMDEMSFSFQATRQDWNSDYTQRTIREMKLFDVSGVTYPANAASTMALSDGRSQEPEVEAVRSVDLTKYRDLATYLKVSA